MYYEAYSLYRSGNGDDLTTARDRLKQLKVSYPAVAKNDGAVLLTRVCGELAKRGDESCAADIDAKAQGDLDVTDGQTVTVPRGSQGTSCPSDDDDNDIRIAALNGLLLIGWSVAVIFEVMRMAELQFKPFRRRTD
jgi:hypothetical protein